MEVTNTTIEHFEDIEGWKEARKLMNMVYGVSKKTEFSKDLGLRNQIHRASISIMSNIAEGFESQSDKEFIKYLYYAKGSAGEIRSHLYVALDQGYINKKEFEELYNQVMVTGKLIGKFISYLESCQKKQTKINHTKVKSRKS